MRIILMCSALLLSSQALANTDAYQHCVLEAVNNVDSEESNKQIRERCQRSASEPSSTEVQAVPREMGAISKRIAAEREIQGSRFALIPHKKNYLLPVTHTSDINREAYDFAGESFADELKHTEAKLQMSLKIPLNSGDIFLDGDGLYFGFTLQSWWQVYADEISAPFRETNYQPELFYMAGLDWQPMGGNTGFVFGIEHQSNGRSQLLSRSWNRVYASFLYEKNNFALSVRPWYRIPEDDKDDPLASDGDDNPDIERYMGNFELKTAYRWGAHEFSMMGRNNLRSDNKGAIELGWSFPLHGNLSGYVQYFNGYGESLVDYDMSQERIGLGFLLSGML